MAENNVTPLDPRQRSKGKGKAKATPTKRADDGRPEINITTELHINVDQAIAALASDNDIYQRDAQLVHIVRAPKGEDHELREGTPTIREMAPATLKERLAAAAHWTKWHEREGASLPALPSPHVVSAAHARGQWQGIRPLIGVIESPSIRPDGTIIDQPGHDAATGFVYLPACDFPAVPVVPTQEDAHRALLDLSEPFEDFPFATDAARSAAIAAILTIVGRPAIRGAVPAFIIDKNTRGAGGTLGVDIISIIGTGREASRMNYPEDPAEMEKVLASYALRGVAIVPFDNISEFGCAPLDRVLTATDFVSLRVLGKSEVPDMRWRAVPLGSGNNIEIIGDTVRRVLIGRIESDQENPEDRDDFKHPDLKAWTIENRPRLTVAALTVLRAYVVADRPDVGCARWGSFEAWGALVPQAIVFAGGADPLDARPAQSGQEDGEKAMLSAFLEGWARLFPEGETVKGAVQILWPAGRPADAAPDGHEGLRDAIESLAPSRPGFPPDARKVGNQIRRFRKRYVGDRYLDCQQTRTRAMSWIVRSRG